MAGQIRLHQLKGISFTYVQSAALQILRNQRKLCIMPFMKWESPSGCEGIKTLSLC